MVFKRAKGAIGIGDRVMATKPLKTMTGTFTKGHRFKVVGEGERGFDLVDDDGNECIEVFDGIELEEH